MSYKSLNDIERVVQLVKPESVIDTFIESYLQGNEYDAWIKEKEAEHSALFPVNIDGEPITDDLGNEIGFEQVPNPDYITFEAWIEETEQVQVGTQDVYDEDGTTVIGTEPVYEDQLIRSYVPIQVDVSGWKATSPLYDQYKKQQRNKLVDELIVAVSTISYDADETAMNRMVRVVAIANFKFNQALVQGTAIADAYDAVYKTAIPWKGADNVLHTIQVESLAEALEKGLTDMADIWVGAE